MRDDLAEVNLEGDAFAGLDLGSSEGLLPVQNILCKLMIVATDK